MNTLLSLHGSKAVEAVHQKTFAPTDTAPEVEAAHDALAGEQAYQRAFETLESDQVLVEPLEMVDRKLLRRIEGKAVRRRVLVNPFPEISAFARKIVVAIASVVRAAVAGTHGPMASKA
jgi:hypothetical protein